MLDANVRRLTDGLLRLLCPSGVSRLVQVFILGGDVFEMGLIVVKYP